MGLNPSARLSVAKEWAQDPRQARWTSSPEVHMYMEFTSSIYSLFLKIMF